VIADPGGEVFFTGGTLMADWLDPDVQAYLDGLVPPRPAELADMEEYARQRGFPIIGTACGQFCYLIARLTGARRVFELGSGFGYSTAWFARAVLENGGGTVHHVVWEPALSDRARGHLAALGLDSVVQFHTGEAVQMLREIDGPFDIIFNDIEKQDYPASLPVIAGKLRPGGVLIIDNMLWGGRVFRPDDRADSVEGVRTVTQMLTTDPAWITSLVPIRDGMMVAYKQ
jgi:predicted O-methyltransferase YrrM